MSFNSSATIYVTNNTGGPAVIVFSHEHGHGGAEIWSSGAPVPDGQKAGPLSVGFNIGLFHTSQDHWFCGAVIADGPHAGAYATGGSLDRPQERCTLQSADDGATLDCSVTTTSFVISPSTGRHTIPMNRENAASAIAARAVKLCGWKPRPVPPQPVPKEI